NTDKSKEIVETGDPKPQDQGKRKNQRNMSPPKETNEENCIPKGTTIEADKDILVEGNDCEGLQGEIQQPPQDIVIGRTDDDQIMNDEENDQGNKDDESNQSHSDEETIQSDDESENQEQSTPTTSNQNSSTKETSLDDDEIMKEAEKGGSEILPVSSTSELSANAGMTEGEFTTMQDSDPATALSLLLTKKWAQSQSSSEKTLSISTQSDTEVRSAGRQD
ncbi:hypothetical protein A2U01_0019002, partial [Trifolium medium]|nr:hypothetical protein [Trifolium medium]